MTQEDDKIKKDFRNAPRIPSGEEKAPIKKGPKFNIYWIYAIIAVVLIGVNLIKMSPDAMKTTEVDFRKNMPSAPCGQDTSNVYYGGINAECFVEKRFRLSLNFYPLPW